LSLRKAALNLDISEKSLNQLIERQPPMEDEAKPEPSDYRIFGKHGFADSSSSKKWHSG
jgi:hypothetical protein